MLRYFLTVLHVGSDALEKSSTPRSPEEVRRLRSGHVHQDEEYVTFMNSTALGELLQNILPEEIPRMRLPPVAPDDTNLEWTLFSYYLPHTRRETETFLTNVCKCISADAGIGQTVLGGRGMIERLPIRLIVFLVDRLQGVSAVNEDDPSACGLTSMCIMCCCLSAVAEADWEGHAQPMAAYGEGDWLLRALRTVKAGLTSQESPLLHDARDKHPSDNISVLEEASAVTAEQRHIALYASDVLLFLLRLLHINTTLLPLRATGLTNEELHTGIGPLQCGIPERSWGSAPVSLSPSFRGETSRTARRRAPPSPTVLARTSLSGAIGRECVHLLLVFAKGELPGCRDLPLVEPEAAVLARCTCSLLVLLTALLVPLLTGLPVPVLESTVHSLVGAVSVLLVRFIYTEEPNDTLVSVYPHLLRQLTCGIVLLTRLLQEKPHDAIVTMSSLRVVEHMTVAVHMMGHLFSLYTDAGDDEPEVGREWLAALLSFGPLDKEHSADRVLVMEGEPLLAVEFNSKIDYVEEFGNSYIGFLAVCQRMHESVEVSADGIEQGFWDRVQRTILDIMHVPVPPHQHVCQSLTDTVAPHIGKEIDDDIIDADVEAASSSSNVLCVTPCLYDLFLSHSLMRTRSHVGMVKAGREVCRFGFPVGVGVHRVLLDPSTAAFASRRQTCLVAFLLLRDLTLSTCNARERFEVMVAVTDYFAVVTRLMQRDKGTSPHLIRAQMLCAVLARALTCDSAWAVSASALKAGCISTLAELTLELSVAAHGKDLCGDGASTEAQMVLPLAMHVLELFIGTGPGIAYMLEREPGLVLHLLARQNLRVQAERMLITMLSFRESCDERYTARMQGVVHSIWNTVALCGGLQETTDSTAISIVDSDNLLLSLLRCMREALNRAQEEGEGLLWGPAFQLQRVLCDPHLSGECFVQLMHRFSQPWVATNPLEGVSAILRTITCLIRGNHTLRAFLFHTVPPRVLVECFRTEWFSATGGAWPGFVQEILAVAYEEIICTDNGSCADPDFTSAAHPEQGVTLPFKPLHNPGILVELLRVFLSLGRVENASQAALRHILQRLLTSMRGSRGSLVAVAHEGVFEVLTKLVAVVEGTELLDVIMEVLVLVATHSIDVRQVKQLLLTVVQAPSLEARQQQISLVIRVLETAATIGVAQQWEPQSFVTFCSASGPVGVRAALPDIPASGYTLALLVRPEVASAQNRMACIFSFQTSERKTVLALMVRDRHLFIEYMDALRGQVSVDLKFDLLTSSWTHLCVAHQPLPFPFRGTSLCFLANGHRVATVSNVTYPFIPRGYFIVGTRGEELEQRSLKSSFVGQITLVYLFGRILSSTAVADLYADSIAPANSGPTVLEGSTGKMQYRAGQTLLFIDPRVCEKGVLYNLSALQRGRPREGRLVLYEGSTVCNVTTVVDAMCVLDAINTVVLPLMVLLVDAQLPFACGAVTRLPIVAVGRVPGDREEELMRHLLRLMQSLVSVSGVHTDALDYGLFVLTSHILEQLGPCLTPLIPQQLAAFCADLVPHHRGLFDAAYTSFFMSAGLLRACNTDTQVAWIRSQRCVLAQNREGRQRMRAVGAQLFVVSEMVKIIKDSPARADELRAEWLQLLYSLTTDPITMDDAAPLIHLLTFVAPNGKMINDAKSEKLLIDVLQASRYLLFSRGVHLAQYLGRRGYAAAVFPLLASPSTSVRIEATLLLLLLISRSKRTQELLNPSLLASKDTVHVFRGVSLAWIAEVLEPYPVDVKTYMMLRCGLIGDFGVPQLPSTYVPLAANDRIGFAAVLEPILLLLKGSSDAALKAHALADIMVLLTNDAYAGRRVIMTSGWYVLITDLYASEATRRSTLTCKETDIHEAQRMISAAAAKVLSTSLYRVLMQERYAAMELQLTVVYMWQMGESHLLCDCLLGLVENYRMRLLRNTEQGITMFCGFGSSLALSNFNVVCRIVEDVLFYAAPSATDGALEAVISNDDTPLLCNKKSYDEWTQLLITSSSPGGGDASRYYEENVYVAASVAASGKDRMKLLQMPDDRWVHLPLALTLAEALSCCPSLLNASSAALAGVAVGTVVDEYHPSGVAQRLRKGGVLRLFTRLVRVACRMTLRSPGHLDRIVHLLDSYLQNVHIGSAFVLKLLRRAPSVTESLEHSPLLTTMVLIHAVNDLLVRRLRAGESGGTLRYSNMNAALLYRLRRLFRLGRPSFATMGVFDPNGPDKYCDGAFTEKSTLEWLCEGEDAMDEMTTFVEVASRTDYDTFMERCVFICEREQLTDKALAKDVVDVFKQDFARLHSVREDLTSARRRVGESLREYVADYQESTLYGEASTSDADTAPALTPSVHLDVESLLHQTTAKVTMAVRSRMWARFLLRSKGNIWYAELAKSGGGEHDSGYVRLSMVEQQPLVRRKVILDRDGTNHRDVTARSLPSADMCEHRNNVDASEARLRLRGGEAVLLGGCAESPCEDEHISMEEAEGPLIESSFPGGGEDTASEHMAPIVFSLPCEIPSMLHCWSAMFFIRGNEVCVCMDDVNTSYNQRVPDAAAPFILPPRNFSFNAGDVSEMAPGRRFRMRRTAVEVWLRDRRSYFINFADMTAMRTVVQQLCRVRAGLSRLHASALYVYQENPQKEPLRMQCMYRWREGKLSNFDYLLWLNRLSGRTLNDISQYPVFPWVIADYASETLDLSSPATFRDLTKPMGACGTAERQVIVQSRYEQMKELGDVPSHYFTHYSSPAVVIFYLLRMEPFTTLHILLQGGHFDHADRLFHSLLASYRGVTRSTQDVRELIPEMYYMPELCVNHNDVHFGVKQDGDTMSHLELPPWADGDPYQLVYCMREALECDYVSAHLHHWIDLIFGHKQRGMEAIQVLNVFNWHSYEELEKNRADTVDPQLLTDMLDNVGQTPIQLFRRPHVTRAAQNLADPSKWPVDVQLADVRWGCPHVALVAVLPSDRVVVVGAMGAGMTMKVAVSPIYARSAGMSLSATHILQMTTPATVDSSALRSTPSCSTIESMTHCGVYRACSFELSGVCERRLPPMPLGATMHPDSSAHSTGAADHTAVLHMATEIFVVIGGLLDQSVIIRSLTGFCGDVRLRAHRGRVIRIAVSGDSCYMVTGAEDTTFVVWRCSLLTQAQRLAVEVLFTIYGHEDHPTAAAVSSSLDLVVTASVDGVMMMRTLSTGGLERTMHHPDGYAIDRLLIQPQCYVPNILYASNVDHVVRQVSINGVPLRSWMAPGRITSWVVTPLQYILVSCTPFDRAVMIAAQERYNDDGGAGAILPPTTPVVLYVHAFYLQVLATVPLSAQHFITSLACHPNNAQVVVAATTDDRLVLLRTCGEHNSVR